MLKTLPVRRWQSRQWHIEIFDGSPSHLKAMEPQWHCVVRDVIGFYSEEACIQPAAKGARGWSHISGLGRADEADRIGCHRPKGCGLRLAIRPIGRGPVQVTNGCADNTSGTSEVPQLLADPLRATRFDSLHGLRSCDDPLRRSITHPTQPPCSFVAGVAVGSRNTRFQAACWALPGSDLHRLIAPASLGAFAEVGQQVTLKV
jgi:hypothetical protein